MIGTALIVVGVVFSSTANPKEYVCVCVCVCHIVSKGARHSLLLHSYIWSFPFLPSSSSFFFLLLLPPLSSSFIVLLHPPSSSFILLHPPSFSFILKSTGTTFSSETWPNSFTKQSTLSTSFSCSSYSFPACTRIRGSPRAPTGSYTYPAHRYIHN